MKTKTLRTFRLCSPSDRSPGINAGATYVLRTRVAHEWARKCPSRTAGPSTGYPPRSGTQPRHLCRGNSTRKQTPSIEKSKKLRLLAALSFLLLCGRQAAHPAPPAHEPTLPIGSAAPDFTLPDLDGCPHDLRDYATPGQVTVLNFWAFWCDTWKAEMPHLHALAPLQKERRFHLVAISVDGTRLEEFRQQNREPTPFPVLLDGGGAVSRAYQIAHVPTVVILDGAGRVRYFHVGYPGNATVLSQIRNIESENKKSPAQFALGI